MESRKITVVSSMTQSKKVINSAATTLGELKTDLTNAGIDFANCVFYEGLSKTELSNDAAILPKDVPFRGTTTNELVFMLTAAKKNIASGSNYRLSLYSEIKSRNLQEVVTKTYGKNYTMCTNKQLEDILGKNEGCVAPITSSASAPSTKEVETLTENKVTALKEAFNILGEILGVHIIIASDDSIVESDTTPTGVEKSPYSDEDIESMFADM